MKKKLILVLSMVAFVVCLLAISVSAVEIDGIDYTFNGDEAYVNSGNQDCGLTVVNIPATVTHEGKTYTVTKINNSAFRYNKTVVSVETPSTIKAIDEHAFREMSALQTVVLKASKEFKCFSNAEFWGNKELVSIDMSGCVGFTGLGNGGTYDDTFDGCSKLERVVLPKGVNYIGRQTFFNCSKLTAIENLDFTNVTYVGYKAFWGTKIGGDVILSENATYVGSHAFRETNITSIVIRAGENCTQTVFDDATFYGCSQLKYVVLPNTLETVGNYTFCGCSSLEYVVLGGNIKEFKTNSTFSNCGALKAIIYKGSEAEFKALGGISALGTVEMVDFASYEHGTLPSKRTVYYNATTCSDCNGIMEKADSFKFTNLVTEMKVSKGCLHCGAETVTENYAPVFECLGFSTFANNGYCAMVQGFRVNYDSLAKYNEKLADAEILGFGVLAVAENKVDGSVFDENGDAVAGSIVSDITTGHNYFEIKVSNIPMDGMVDENTAYVDAKLYMCAFIKTAQGIVYVDGGYAGATLGTAISYNDVK